MLGRPKSPAGPGRRGSHPAGHGRPARASNHAHRRPRVGLWTSPSRALDHAASRGLPAARVGVCGPSGGNRLRSGSTQRGPPPEAAGPAPRMASKGGRHGRGTRRDGHPRARRRQLAADRDAVPGRRRHQRLVPPPSRRLVGRRPGLPAHGEHEQTDRVLEIARATPDPVERIAATKRTTAALRHDVEVAIRAWAAVDPVVGEAQRRFDEQRRTALAEVLGGILDDPAEARRLAGFRRLPARRLPADRARPRGVHPVADLRRVRGPAAASRATVAVQQAVAPGQGRGLDPVGRTELVQE